ncbi:MAG TPA: Na+/H+ antiporter NhaC family protein [Longimicrobiales bacterium]|nr:Na+/H+ antiporter NhaC family protein [Longimicrobiales bacterium]
MRFPHPLTLLLGAVIIAAVLTWVLPAGEFERAEHPETGREIVVAGSYHRVEADPVGPFEAIVALPRGMIEAADVIFLVFLVGGAFMVIDRTGAFQAGLDRLVRSLGAHELLVIPIACFAFGIGGALQNMQEEFIALIPVLLLLTSRLGFRSTVAVAMSLGAAAVGASFSPINPFQVGIAQRVADVELLSGAAYRTLFLGLALALWSWGTMRFARRTRGARAPMHAMSEAARPTAEEEPRSPHETGPQETTGAGIALTGRHTVILVLVAIAFAIYVYGAMRLEWGFNEMSALFFLLGVAAGLIGRLGAEGTADAFVEGFKAMAFAAILIGFARAIYVVLADGRIVDTIVFGLFQPLQGLPRSAAAVGMMGVQTIIHVPVPSVSGQAVLTMPILAPLSDLLGFSRQIAILAYQYGAGLCDLITPTNGALMAVIAAARVRYDDWLQFVLPMWGMLFALGAVSVLVALAIGLT